MKDQKKSKAGKIGGLAACSIERTCPHCGRKIVGCVYFYHVKKCESAHINNSK